MLYKFGVGGIGFRAWDPPTHPRSGDLKGAIRAWGA